MLILQHIVCVSPPPLPQESFHTRNAITYIKTHEAVAKLRENLRAEHNVTIEFCAAVFKGVSGWRSDSSRSCEWRGEGGAAWGPLQDGTTRPLSSVLLSSRG
jgi:hypothetical protein